MNEEVALLDWALPKPALPTPTRERWQPLRLGLVELFHYDSEEFWFRDGHLLLRGNNGTGKSKVLSLTLPFLLDAQLKPSRIEPDGDSGKRMAWNLLMNSYPRRMGYAWIEFGRRAADGTARYLSLGAGLSATASRPQVDSWFFILEDSDRPARINSDVWLTSPQRVVLTKERLRDLLEGRGQVFDSAKDYRRAVDERLLHLGTRRYEALMDTLIQLRQPQLSRKPDETALSNALTEALPPLAPELLADVAQALGQLEEDRRQLEEFQALAQAVDRFEQRYRVYAGTQSRRQARVLRQAQTDFDNASRARGEAQAHLEATTQEEGRARSLRDQAEIDLAGARARHEALQLHPTMQDASRLDQAEKEAKARRESSSTADAARHEAERRLSASVDDTGHAAQRAERAEQTWSRLRLEAAGHAEAAGVAVAHAAHPFAGFDRAALVGLDSRSFDAADRELRAVVAGRREQVGLLRERHAEAGKAEARYMQSRTQRDERQLDADAAESRRHDADAEVERAGRVAVEQWQRHLEGLQILSVDPDAAAAALDALADWVVGPTSDNPARQALQYAQLRATERLAGRHAELASRRQDLEREIATLEDERARLEAGVDASPPPPYTRSPDARSVRMGAPLWQLVDFRQPVTAAERAGLEAALEASGLLDAWVTPDGCVQTAGGEAIPHDIQLQARGRRTASLADWLMASVPSGNPVAAGVVAQVLSSIACSLDDPSEAEAWVSPDGRFRLAGLAGAWAKPAAAYVGHAARAAARARRLAEIADGLAVLGHDLADVQALAEELALDRRRADDEWRRAPADDDLKHAHIVAANRAAELLLARERFAEADGRCRDAEAAVRAARQQLVRDAADLRLPDELASLPPVEIALDHYRDVLVQLVQASHELRLAVPELQRRQDREDEAREDLGRAEYRLGLALGEAEEATARFEAVREAVGAEVEALQRRLADARLEMNGCDGALRRANAALHAAGAAHAVAKEKADAAESLLQQRADQRSHAVSRWQLFVATGLFAAALPQMELPSQAAPWTIDPALTLARRAEQALAGLPDDDDSWTRVQRQANEGFAELQRALSALAHQTMADHGDWGFVVHIVYQNRPERPDRLAALLNEEIVQRSELLTAKERAILENHLQAEIASEIQRLLQGAERQRDSINKELHKRPTSTGVRFRLMWQTLSEDEGAPVGLEAARKRLLNTSADLWSAEDRSVVGAMLQQCIAAERERSEAIGGRGGSLLDQLAAALDYRRWHRFRVERWQDGSWRKLSGPASSGERALGLTVPLFAAVASFYSQGAHALAPRLMLLDEAFAGIDDAARAHCMALIREFDLDFVITSEREWGCYAELPGVAICQLQRREGIDAIFVSRWSWDGKARTLETDPDRRYAPA
ncbi:TIGR02680 family protein [Reyranella sp.]|uniref:TIGR02680 family protein n=1 Tax=Reyranella sp. TaxID=1929291 RepID=UPI003783ADCE